MSNFINLDFTNVKEFTNLPAGKHTLRVKKYEQAQASTGNNMLVITFENANGETGIDRFVLTESALWKFKNLLSALFRQNFQGKFDFDLDQMIGKTCTAVAKEEEYVKQDGTTDIRIVLDNYMPINDADVMGVTPGAPTPQPVMPNPAMPTPQVAPAPQVAPTPQPQVYVAPQPMAQPQGTPGFVQAEANPFPQAQVQPQPQVVAQPQVAQTYVAPQPQVAQPTPAPATPQVAKRPWE